MIMASLTHEPFFLGGVGGLEFYLLSNTFHNRSL